MGLFRRGRRAATETSGLGHGVIALRLARGDAAPAACRVVIIGAGGQARRGAPGRIAHGEGETVYCFHPGPYSVELTPFAAAPELGLRLRFVIDAADPRVSQQRFDLFLHSEVEARLDLADMGWRLEAALRLELQQGNLEFPPCATLEEWHAFRAGLNQLCYTRYGMTVDDCLPLDLGERVDFADMLAERAARTGTHGARDGAAPAAPAPVPATAGVAAASGAGGGAADDARALRRLFLELPALSSALRQLDLPEGPAMFQARQAMLRRVALMGLGVGTMPTLGWATPDQPLDAVQQARRARNSMAAAAALDEAWALLARWPLAAPPGPPELLDEADRICANLEHFLSLRRAPYEPIHEDELGVVAPQPAVRKEPFL